MCKLRVALLGKNKSDIHVRMQPVALATFENIRFALFHYESTEDNEAQFHMDFDRIEKGNPHGISLGSLKVSSFAEAAISKRSWTFDAIREDVEKQKIIIASILHHGNPIETMKIAGDVIHPDLKIALEKMDHLIERGILQDVVKEETPAVSLQPLRL